MGHATGAENKNKITMSTATTYKLSFAVLFSAMVVLAFGYTAHAGSVVWNGMISGGVGVSCMGTTNPDGTLVDTAGCSYGFNNPNITVQYRAFIKNTDTGAIILPGSSVPVGTHLSLVFDQSLNTDISWVETGAYFDTPYGRWGDPSSPPPRAECLEQDYIDTQVYFGSTMHNYVPFIVMLPDKSVGGMSTDLTCDALVNGTQSCTASNPGTVPVVFNFASTIGKFYYRYYRVPEIGTPTGCHGPDYHMTIKVGGSWPGSGNYAWAMFDQQSGDIIDNVDIGAESIPYPINIVAATSSPFPPTVTATYCTVGSPVTILFTSTDSNNRPIRYGVHWDADGSVDQWIPLSGYVNSGTQQSASRTYTTAGQKTIRVVAQNDQGALSPPTPYSFSCNAGGIRCPIGYVEQNGQCVFSACPAGYMLQSGQCIPACTPVCQGADIVNSCTHDVLQHCDWGCANGTCNSTPAPTGDISATPALVPSGDTTSVSWTSQNATACTVTSTNGSSWTGLYSASQTSLPILAQTIFSLHCTGYPGADPTYFDKSVTVNLIPNFQEL